ncbi:MAG: TAXI family TRAP transporter solute-binding subunit [Corynebacterium sp.]|uniref:TAXI family TRAP transporter solute-binding subunit n=1 Tax=Corynebacterium sp. TaxID=1720 RepID=UPI0026E099F1|nr:TAXI family TRAP transporter solute-binding subunit [Corynebacterium sp.]MDO5670155.1 TAXI family TRAP transporter solute-binding subunit [Corynebacterium sp.]
MALNLNRRQFLKGLAFAGAAATLGACAKPVETTVAGMPGRMVWTTYPVGTGTYNDIAAVASMITTRSGAQVRLMTGDTGIGRIAPLISGVADYARVGDESLYSFEGDYEYTSEVWGPQPVRQLWTPPGSYGMAVLKNSGIDTVHDLRGKRLPYLLGMEPTNRKIDAIVQLGDMTLDDVTLVPIAFSEQTEALKTGHLDGIYTNSVGAGVEELNTRYPIHWLDFGGQTEAQKEVWADLIPLGRVGSTSEAVGMGPDDSAELMQFSLAMLTRADVPEEEVYSVVKLMHDHHGDFKNSTPDAKFFAIDQIILDPLVVPFHPGVVRLLEESNLWTPDLDRRQKALLEREILMQEEWPNFWDRHKSSEDPSTEWRTWKQENLPALPPINDTV